VDLETSKYKSALGGPNAGGQLSAQVAAALAGKMQSTTASMMNNGIGGGSGRGGANQFGGPGGPNLLNQPQPQNPLGSSNLQNLVQRIQLAVSNGFLNPQVSGPLSTLNSRNLKETRVGLGKTRKNLGPSWSNLLCIFNSFSFVLLISHDEILWIGFF